MAVKSTPKNQSSDDLAKLVTELHAEMHVIREDLKALVGAAGTAAKGELGALKQAAPERAKEALEIAEKTVEAQVNGHPWRTLGIVGLAGFAFGLLIRR